MSILPVHTYYTTTSCKRGPGKVEAPPPLDPSFRPPCAPNLGARLPVQTAAMPPPPLPSSPKPRVRRTKIRTVRLSDEEWADLDRLLVGREWSAWVRSRLLPGREHPEPSAPPEGAAKEKRVIVRKMSEFESRKIQQLAWIGNNLNQIARAANQGAGSLYLAYALARMERDIKDLANAR